MVDAIMTPSAPSACTRQSFYPLCVCPQSGTGLESASRTAAFLPSFGRTEGCRASASGRAACWICACIRAYFISPVFPSPPSRGPPIPFAPFSCAPVGKVAYAPHYPVVLPPFFFWEYILEQVIRPPWGVPPVRFASIFVGHGGYFPVFIQDKRRSAIPEYPIV